MPQTADARAAVLGQLILAEARQQGLAQGARLPELALARVCGVSRTPVRRALAHLEEQGLVQKGEGGGYCLAVTPGSDHLRALKDGQPQETDTTALILRDLGQRRIGPTVTISELARRYALPRGRIQSALEELALLSVITKSEGQSWVFHSDIVTARSNRQSLDFRMALETAALEAPGFHADAEALKAVLQASEDILARPPNGIAPHAFAAAEQEFHGFIARASGNHFIEGAITSHLTLLDLLAPRLGFNDHMARVAIGDHLQILLDIEAGRLGIARDRLRLHLATAHGPQDWAHARPVLPTEGTR